MVMRHIIVSFLVVISLISVSCTSKLPSFRPYKMDIQQGNVVTSKMMLQLRPGMTKSQVRFIMGTPLIQDSFHSNRWDYFYQMRKDGKIIEQRRVILDFEKEALLRVRGDVIPAGTGDPAAGSTTGTEPVSQPEDKKSLMDKLKFWKSDKKEQAPEPQAAPTDLVNPTAKPADTKPEAREAAPASLEAAPSAESASPEPVSQPAPAVESQPAPAPVAQPALAPEPITDPAEPVPAVQPAKAEEPVSAPVAKPEPVAEPIAKPASRPAPAPVVEPEAKPAAVESAKKAVEKPAAEPVKKAEPAAKPAAAPAAEKEPPREDEPGYFEYMLEKIGF